MIVVNECCPIGFPLDLPTGSDDRAARRGFSVDTFHGESPSALLKKAEVEYENTVI